MPYLEPRFGLDVSLGVLALGGCAYGAVKGSDVFSDKQAVQLMNPAYLRNPTFDSFGNEIFMPPMFCSIDFACFAKVESLFFYCF